VGNLLNIYIFVILIRDMLEYAPNRCFYPSRRLNQVSTPGACPVLESAGSSALQLLIIYAQTVHIQKFDGIGTLKECGVLKVLH
jgi:hypothetical protein